MNILIRIFNHRFYPILTALVFAVAAFFLLRDGVGPIDVIVLLAIPLLSYAIWRALVTEQTAEMDDVERVRQALKNGQKATVLQFFSRYCAGCIAVKPIVDHVEQEAADRIQIIRLDIDEEPGKTLMREYGVRLTPTFVYFDPHGKKLGDSVFALDTWQVLYE